MTFIGVAPTLAVKAPSVARGEVARTSRASRRARRAATYTTPHLPDSTAIAVLDVPEMPELDIGSAFDPMALYEERVAEGMEFGEGLKSDGPGAPPTPVYADVYLERDADRLPVALAGSVRPVYPMPLMLGGVSGDVIARFVIDSAGKPDVASLQIVSSSHALFARSVRDAVRRMRFLPAQLGGRAVKVLAEQRFSFVLR